MNFPQSLCSRNLKIAPLIFVFICYLLSNLNTYAVDPSYRMDFDGDGKTDLAVYRGGTWFILQSSNNQIVRRQFGTATDIPLTMPNSNIYH